MIDRGNSQPMRKLMLVGPRLDHCPQLARMGVVTASALPLTPPRFNAGRPDF
jgi:hypothetical protein